MAVNKVVYNGETLVDLTGDTVTPANLRAGVTAHGADGEGIVGEMSYTADDIGAVPITRKINNKALSEDITLTAEDVDAAPAIHTHSAANIGAAPANHTHTPSDVGADPEGSAAEVAGSLYGHVADTDKHITAAERALWNGRTNPNLLRGWYFVGGGTAGKFPVNRCEQASYTGARCGIDGWDCNASGFTVTVHSDGVTISNTGPSGVFRQYLETPFLRGRAYTAAMLATAVSGNVTLEIQAGGLGSFVTQAVSAPGLVTASGVCPTQSSTQPDRLLIRLPTNSSITLAAAKLELGSQQTLAHQENGVWVLNEMPDYAVEYAKCCQYSLTDGTYIGVLNGIGAVPITRKVNNKALDADISLTAADVGTISVDPAERTNFDMDAAPLNSIISCVYAGGTNQTPFHTPLGSSTEVSLYILETHARVSGLRNAQIAYLPFSHQRRTFIRYGHDNIWSPWREIITSGNIAAQNVNYANGANVANVSNYSLQANPSESCLRNARFSPTVDTPSVNGNIVWQYG